MRIRIGWSLVLLVLVTAIAFRSTGSADSLIRVSQDGSPGATADASGVAAFRGDPARTGRQAGPGPVGAPVLAWETNVPGGIADNPNGTPGSGVTVSDGIAYLGEPQSGAMFALDAATGQRLWRYESPCDVMGMGCPVLNTPAVADGLVVVSSVSGGFAVDAVTGDQRWRYVGSSSISSSPLVVDGVAYVQGGPTVAAIDAATGELRWRFDHAGNTLMFPVVAGGTIYTSTYGGDAGETVHAFDLATGVERVSYADGGERFRAAAANGLLYLTTESDLIALDAATLGELWRADPGDGLSAPAVADGVVYVGTAEGLRSFDAATGEARWQTTSESLGDPSVADGVVYAPGTDVVVAIDAATGAELWRFAGAGQVVWAVADGYVFASGAADELSGRRTIVAIGGTENPLPSPVTTTGPSTPASPSTTRGQSGCEVKPRKLFELLDLIPPDVTPSPVTPTPPPWDVPAPGPYQPPSGTPADQSTVAEIEATVREELACRNDGAMAAAYALFTDAYVVGRVIAGESAGKLLSSVRQQAGEGLVLVEIRDVTVLPDGRVAALVVYRDPVLRLDAAGSESHHVLYAEFARVGDRWLFDSVLPVAAPAGSE